MIGLRKMMNELEGHYHLKNQILLMWLEFQSRQFQNGHVSCLHPVPGIERN